jgi:GTP cyclohydrolase II
MRKPAVRSRVDTPIEIGDGRWAMTTMLTFHGLSDPREHLALMFGDLSVGVLHVRLHSECLTGDVFRSVRCDCGAQLRESLELLARVGGVLLYLRQEGRDVGLYNKLDAYRLQDQGLDTYAANRALNLPEDARDYRIAAEMLTALGITRIRLITNNPEKAGQLASLGIEVREVIRTGVFATDRNRRYLRAKVEHAGHRIRLPADGADGGHR